MKARLPQGYGKVDRNALLQQYQKMQQEMENLTADLEAREHTVTAGGDAGQKQHIPILDHPAHTAGAIKAFDLHRKNSFRCKRTRIFSIAYPPGFG